MILLPFPSFRESVACYSDNLLWDTMRFILKHQRGMRKDPQYRQRGVYLFWNEYKQAYIHLGMMCADELKKRDISYDDAKASRLFQEVKDERWKKPLWVGWDRLHASHRAAILQLGDVELATLRLVQWRNWDRYTTDARRDKVYEWFDYEGFHGLADGDERYIADIHRLLDERGAPPLSDEICNPYAHLGWSEIPCGRLDIRPPDPGTWLVENCEQPDEAVECDEAVAAQPRRMSDNPRDDWATW